MPAISTHVGARQGRRLRIAVAAGLVLALALLALLHRHGRFDGSVVAANGKQVYVAREGERVRLRFIDRLRAGTAYRVTTTSTGSIIYGFTGRTGKPGAPQRLVLPDVGPPSRVSVRWTVAGRTAARWVFLVRPSKRR